MYMKLLMGDAMEFVCYTHCFDVFTTANLSVKIQENLAPAIPKELIVKDELINSCTLLIVTILTTSLTFLNS